MTWQARAAALAAQVTHDRSRWRGPVATTPRHLFVPRWWQADEDGRWALKDGPADAERWLSAAYDDRSLVTKAGPLHADQATGEGRPTGMPTSSATQPSLTVRMLQHAHLGDGDTLISIGTGSGYGDALAARRLGDRHLMSVDVDPYLTQAAADRLDRIGLHPALHTLNATMEPLPGTVSRLVATVAVRSIPPAWLEALRPGGRLVTTIAGTSLIITATKEPDGGASGRVEWDRGGFMHARHGADHPPGHGELPKTAREEDGEYITTGRYPVIPVGEAWDLASMLAVTVPGIEAHYHQDGEQRTAWLVHPDGSWARATARGGEPPTIHQSGPRRLWDELDRIREYWLEHGELPVRGAKVWITPEGTTYLARGDWHTQLTP